MKRYFINVSFGSLSATALFAQSRYIVNMLTGNLYYTTLAAAIVAIGDINKDLETAMDNAAKGDKVLIAIRDAIMLTLVGQLEDLGYDVIALAKGNKEKLLTSGFPPRSPNKTSEPITKPEPPKVFSTGVSGQILSKNKGQRVGKSTSHFITEAPLTPQSIWREYQTGYVNHIFENCVPGQGYLIKYCVIGVRKQCLTSEPIMWIAQ